MKKTILAIALTLTATLASATAIFDGISTRGWMAGGDRALIAGFSIPAGHSKDVVIGCLGAETGLKHPAANTDLYLFRQNSRGNTLVASNKNWTQDQNYADTDDFLRLAGVRVLAGNAVITRRLSSGAYTAHCVATPGLGIVFVYDYGAPKLLRR